MSIRLNERRCLAWVFTVRPDRTLFKDAHTGSTHMNSNGILVITAD